MQGELDAYKGARVVKPSTKARQDADSFIRRIVELPPELPIQVRMGVMDRGVIPKDFGSIQLRTCNSHV